jgi:hypothetical protein
MWSREFIRSHVHCTTPVKTETVCLYIGEFARFVDLSQELMHRLAELAPKLRPELLHRVIGAYGLEDCVELVAHATPAQLSHLFDLDLWRPPRPGLDEHFDAARFGLWIEVLAEAGADVAAAKLAAMPLRQVVAGLAHHVLVFDVSAVASYETTDGTRIDYSRPVRDLVGCEIGGYHVAATRDDSWDAIVAVLVSLDMHHSDRFVELMRAVRSRSHSRREHDGLHALLQNREQMMFDLADERQRRRRDRGFASPADARAFLQMSRRARLETLAPNPIARDYARSIECAADQQEAPVGSPAEEIEVAEMLAEAGVAPLNAPRALLDSGKVQPATRLQRCMRVVCERDRVAFGERHFELAYLANVLMAGCSIQGRPFTAKEAADASVAICNLGLEQLPVSPDDVLRDYLITHDLIGAFQLGWTTLHEQACVFAGNALADTLADVRAADADVQSALNMLRIRLIREIENGTPWRAADALDALQSLDMPAWAALVALIAECPVIHGGLIASIDRRVRSVDPTAFDFISGPDQLRLIRSFMRALSAILSRT